MTQPQTHSSQYFLYALQVAPAAYVDATAVESIELDALRTGCILRMTDGARVTVPPRSGMDAHRTLHWLLAEVEEQARRTRWARANGQGES